MSFLNCGKCGEAGNDGNGDDGPGQGRNREEEKETCQFVGRGVREAEAFADNQRRNLIDDFDGDNDPCPNPQPCRNMQNGNQLYCAASYKADISHAIQHSTGLTLGVESPRQVPIDHITNAAQAIDYPESRPCRITEQQTGGPKESEGSDYIGNVTQLQNYGDKNRFQFYLSIISFCSWSDL